jgi:hypothetical protein
MKSIRLLLAVSMLLAFLVACSPDSVPTTPTLPGNPPASTTDESSEYSDSDVEISSADFTALALPQVNAERREAGMTLAQDCIVIGSFKGKSIYVEDDNSLGLLAKKGKGSVEASDAKGREDLIFVWFPVNLDTRKLRRATLAAGLCD